MTTWNSFLINHKNLFQEIYNIWRRGIAQNSSAYHQWEYSRWTFGAQTWVNVKGSLPLRSFKSCVHFEDDLANVLDRVMAPPNDHVLGICPVSCEYMVRGTLQMRWGIILDYPNGSSVMSWVPKSKGPFLAVVRGWYEDRREMRHCWVDPGGRGHKPTNVGGLWKLEQARNRIP